MKQTRLSLICLAAIFLAIFAGTVFAAEGASGDCSAVRAGVPNVIGELAEADAIAACQQQLSPGEVSLGSTWTIFTDEYPDTQLDASPYGWEVGTKFVSSTRGTVVGFRFWKAVGEVDTNYAKLWTNSGTQLTSEAFPTSQPPGWVYVEANPIVHIIRNQIYRVSVNTNSEQVKRAGAYVVDGPISNGPLYSDSGYYGQPIHDMPSSGSASMFFVDVYMEERSFPMPGDPLGPPYFADPRISRIQANLVYQGQEIVLVRVCNNGNGAAPPSQLKFQHFVATQAEKRGRLHNEQKVAVGELAANACQDLAIQAETVAGGCNQLHASFDNPDAPKGVQQIGNHRFLSYCKKG